MLTPEEKAWWSGRYRAKDLTRLAAGLEDKKIGSPPSRANSFQEAYMTVSSLSLDGGLIPEESTPLPAESADWEGLFEDIAADLYRVASMLLGEGEAAIALVEQAIGGDAIAVGKSVEQESFEQARHAGRLLIAGEAIGILGKRDGAALAAPEVDADGPVSCIEGDELDAAGVTSAELEAMLTGPDNHRLRSWIEGLPVQLRVTFVLRSVANLTSPEIAGLLGEYGGPEAAGWTPEAVRSVFRQALCSLAGQLLHATAER